jgi:hypothetical protein
VVSRGTDFEPLNRPFFDEAEMSVRAAWHQITLRATGTMAKLGGSCSDPPLPEVEILSLLLGDVRSTEDRAARPRSPNSAEQNRSCPLGVATARSSTCEGVEQTTSTRCRSPALRGL